MSAVRKVTLSFLHLLSKGQAEEKSYIFYSPNIRNDLKSCLHTKIMLYDICFFG